MEIAPEVIETAPAGPSNTSAPIRSSWKLWCDEDRIILAKAYLEAEARSEKVGPKALMGCLRNRTYDAIKGQLKDPRFKELLELSRTNEGVCPLANAISGGGDDNNSPVQDLSQACDQSEQHLIRLREALESFPLHKIDLPAPNMLPSITSQGLVDNDLEEWLPAGTSQGKRAKGTTKLPKNARKRRRVMYKRVQTTWKYNRKRCAEEVISGAWESEESQVSMDQLLKYWEPLLTTESCIDNRRVDPIREEQWGAMVPFTIQEVNDSLKGMKASTAPGPDQKLVSDLKALPLEQLRYRFNLWLYLGVVPMRLCEGYTSLIPKIAGTDKPNEFRPITVSSVLIRLYHKTLSRRLERLCPPSVRQKAFRSGDGIAENLCILQALLKKAQDPRVPRDLALAFLDVRKAFDSVAHGSLLKAAERAGVPKPVTEYIGRFYSNSTTRLRFRGGLSHVISVKQGVKQGDPLSCILFNLVIDWALDQLSEHIMFDVGNGVGFNHAAFADDVILAANRKDGLQAQVNLFTDHLQKSGMTVNAGKCATIAIVVNGKSRKWVVDPRRFLKIGDSPELVKALSVADTYKYLGIQASASGSTSCAEGKLERLLRQISRAPLKPQQRLWILNTRVFPSLRHDLVFCRTGKGFLRHLDRKVKTAVKGWLKLPKDTSDPSFWASVSDGGLGILSLEHCVPEWKRSRLTCMQFATNDPIMIELLAGNWLRKEIRMWSKPVTWRAHVMNCAETRSEAYRTELYRTIDGRGLKSTSLVPEAHQWVSNGTACLRAVTSTRQSGSG